MGYLNLLRLPAVRGRSLDDPEMPMIHGAIIQSKPFLRKLYVEFYRILGQRCDAISRKTCIELGSGGGFIKTIYPTVLTSDLVCSQNVDYVFSVLKMPFANSSIDCFFMVDVFHHIADSRAFLCEMDRCLKPMGKIIMVEPANTIWGSLIYQNFHHETFNPAGSWRLNGTSPLSSANGALPWIVFFRDRRKFVEMFPNLTVNLFKAHTPLTYLLSGGVSYRQLLPSFTYSAVKGVEWLLSPLNPLIGMHYTIELRKQLRHKCF